MPTNNQYPTMPCTVHVTLHCINHLKRPPKQTNVFSHLSFLVLNNWLDNKTAEGSNNNDEVEDDEVEEMPAKKKKETLKKKVAKKPVNDNDAADKE